MGLSIAHKTHHHPFGTGREVFDGVHLKACQREPLSQGICDKGLARGAHQLLQPLERDAH